MLVSDVDTVWLRDPREWFETDDLPRRTDVSISTDCLSHEEEKKTHGCWHMQFNTGILWLRPTTPTKELMSQWRDALLTTEVGLHRRRRPRVTRSFALDGVRVSKLCRVCMHAMVHMRHGTDIGGGERER